MVHRIQHSTSHIAMVHDDIPPDDSNIEMAIDQLHHSNSPLAMDYYDSDDSDCAIDEPERVIIVISDDDGDENDRPEIKFVEVARHVPRNEEKHCDSNQDQKENCHPKTNLEEKEEVEEGEIRSEEETEENEDGRTFNGRILKADKTNTLNFHVTFQNDTFSESLDKFLTSKR